MHEDYRYEYTGKRRFFVITGAAFVLVGLGLVGLAAYAVFMRPGADDSWLYVIPGRDDDSPAFDAAPPPGAVLAGQRYSLVIERLGVEAPVGVFGLDANAVPEVPYDPNTVAWYNFSSEPGAGGNAVFAGHRTWRGDAVFRHLEDIQAGDRVILRGEGGTQLVYQVFHSELIDPANATASSWMLPTDFDVITLITCGGDYRKTNDPIFGAEYDKRQVVRAALVRDGGSTGTGG